MNIVVTPLYSEDKKDVGGTFVFHKLNFDEVRIDGRQFLMPTEGLVVRDTKGSLSTIGDRTYHTYPKIVDKHQLATGEID